MSGLAIESRIKTRADYPHLDDQEWDAARALAAVLGDGALFHILEMEVDAQRAALRNFRNSSMRRSNPPSAHRAESVKIDASVYQALEGESLPRWFVEVDAAIFARQIADDAMQVVYAMSRLKGRASTWAFSKRMTDPTCFPNWKALKGELMTTFQPPKSEFRLRTKFLQLRQGRRSVHEYAQEARMLVSSIMNQPIDQATQVSVFLNGLGEGPVRDQLYRVFPDTLESAMTLALQEDFSRRQSRQGSHARYGHESGYTRVGQGPTPMDVSRIEMERPRGSFDKSSVTCYACHKKGHFARECRLVPSNNGGRRFRPSTKPKVRRNFARANAVAVLGNGDCQ